MDTLQELSRRLQKHKRDCAEIPSLSEADSERRILQEKLLRLQWECEEWRFNLRTAFAMSATDRFVKKVEGDSVEYMRTVFNWEPVRDELMRLIQKKELEGIAYLHELYNRTYAENQQTAV